MSRLRSLFLPWLPLADLLAAVLPGLTGGAVVLAAALAADLRGPGGQSAAAYQMLAGALTSLGMATLAVSVGLSLLQESAKWPSYIYRSVRDDPERTRIIEVVVAGFVVAFGDMAALALGLASGLVGSLCAIGLALAAFVLICGYVITRISLFDPVTYAKHTARQMRRLHPLLFAKSERGAGAHRRYLESLDCVLGIARWLAENEKSQDAAIVIRKAMAEVLLYSHARQRRKADDIVCWWFRPSTRQRAYTYLPDSSESLLGDDLLRHNPPKADPLWLEDFAAIWLSRTMCILGQHGADLDTWDAWNDFSYRLMRMAYDLDDRHGAVIHIRSWLRPIVAEIGKRVDRDKVFERLGDFLSKKVTLVQEKGEIDLIEHGWWQASAHTLEGRTAWLNLFTGEMRSRMVMRLWTDEEDEDRGLLERRHALLTGDLVAWCLMLLRQSGQQADLLANLRWGLEKLEAQPQLRKASWSKMNILHGESYLGYPLGDTMLELARSCAPGERAVLVGRLLAWLSGHVPAWRQDWDSGPGVPLRARLAEAAALLPAVPSPAPEPSGT